MSNSINVIKTKINNIECELRRIYKSDFVYSISLGGFVKFHIQYKELSFDYTVTTEYLTYSNTSTIIDKIKHRIYEVIEFGH